MKKILFTTTAIVAAGFTSAASAAEWETGVSGYYFLGLGMTDSDLQDGVGVLRDGEFNVDGRLTADNGLVFAAHIEVEAFTSSDQIDENWGAVRGSFGRIKIGSDDDAMYNYQVGTIYAPGARIGYYDSFALTNVARSTSPGNAPYRGVDGIGIHYDSPNFNGFQIGATYIPDSDTDGSNDTNNPVYSADDFYAIGANYQGDFGDFGFGISGGYADADHINDSWNVGANVSYGGFTVAGIYEDDDLPDEEWALGAQYATGPWTIAGGYSNSGGTDLDIGSGWVTYALAPGVLMTAGLEYADSSRYGKNFGGLAYMTLRF